MIYDWHNRKLILTPPKTASSTLHTELCARRGCFYLLAMTGWGRVSKHCSLEELGDEPYEFALGHDFQVLLAVRHPTDRLISMYRHQVSYDQYPGTFRQWARDRQSAAAKNWLRSCHAYLGNRSADGVIRTEFLNRDLKTFSLPAVRLRINQSKSDEPIDREFAAQTAREWWPDDWQYYADEKSD